MSFSEQEDAYQGYSETSGFSSPTPPSLLTVGLGNSNSSAIDDYGDHTLVSRCDVGIAVLPGEVLEQIFQNICPYRDFPNCKLVCSWWRTLICGVARRKQREFRASLGQGKVRWTKLRHRADEAGYSVTTDRYSHCACYIDGDLYVFGGCTAAYTTFNDLWRFDLACKRWIRPMANGTYPSPKACSTMVVWRNQLVLFGGWSQPTPFPLHQAALFFNQLHFYDTTSNTWTAISSDHTPPPVAGHASCMMGDRMIVFGGSHQLGFSTDELWEFDMLTQRWKQLMTGGDECKPLPRYGASMNAINDTQAVILGGCGGPNMKFTDCWLLTVPGSGESRYTVSWVELDVRNAENSCLDPLWCHPTCKVDNLVIVLSKISLPVDPDVLARISTRQAQLEDNPINMTSYSSSSSDDEEVRNRSNMAAAAGGARPGQQQRRQKQLAMLEKFERRMRNSRAQSQAEKSQETPSLLKQPMFVHSLDISTVFDGYVSWNPLNTVDVYGEVIEETFFYSLTQGRGELILFGGMYPENELGMRRPSPTSTATQVLNDSVYIIKGV